MFEELEALHRAKGIDERASHYASLRDPAAKQVSGGFVQEAHPIEFLCAKP